MRIVQLVEATDPRQKEAQRAFFFWYDPAKRPGIIASLRRINRPDLIPRILPGR